MALDPSDVGAALQTALAIRGLGTAGASGLLALLYPRDLTTVDQFVVKALRGHVTGGAVAWVCHGMTCLPPVATLADVERVLAADSRENGRP